MKTQEFAWGNKTWRLETGKVARQASGAVVVSCGDTVVLATAVYGARLNTDFLPLTVNYQEKAFSAGKIPGGFFKREGRPSEKETLTSRLIDRPIRPLFVKGYTHETQVVCTLLSHDDACEPDIVAMIGASAALALAGVPFAGPIAGARVGLIEGSFVLNPARSELHNSELDLVMAGTAEGILMVESQASELSEETMLEALSFGFGEFATPLKAIAALVEEAGKPRFEIETADAERKQEIANKLTADYSDRLVAAYGIVEKQERVAALSALRQQAAAEWEEDPLVGAEMKALELKLVREATLSSKRRIDGRRPDEIRQIEVDVGVLPRTHGSALFTRGETQALAVATLGTGEDEQIVDAIEGEYREKFLLHYNFPPYSVGEASMLRPPGRREVGHGKLAWRAIYPLLPEVENFPYTLRVVSEITESNGSSSMATVCGTSLALMSAGVPMKGACAGIAMGLIKSDDSYVILSDILGDEDHLGDMDFKVAGTEQGITALQMDIKITSITQKIMQEALVQAREGRLYILREMNKVMAVHGKISMYAPRIESLMIPKEKIREVIGTGGKVIRQIVEQTGAKIDIEDDGTVKVASSDGPALEKAVKWIKDIVAEPEAGQIYQGTVEGLTDFGAFVDFMSGKSGLVHVSNIVDYHLDKVSSVLSEGQKVWVKCLEVDPRGKIRLSMKHVNQQTGEAVAIESSGMRRNNNEDRHNKKRGRGPRLPRRRN